jgi:hypothetical protein
MKLILVNGSRRLGSSPAYSGSRAADPAYVLVDMNGATPTHGDGEPDTGAAPSLFAFDFGSNLRNDSLRIARPRSPDLLGSG